MAKRINGIELDTLRQTMRELERDPELGKSKFRATNEWLDGTRNVNRITGFYAVKQEMEHPRIFEIQADEPTILAGGDTFPNPVEYLLGALASCVTSAMVLHAAVQGVEIRSIESKVEGDLDVNGLAGLSDEVPKGYQQIRIELTVDADAELAQLERMARMSPTLDTISRGTSVDMKILER